MGAILLTSAYYRIDSPSIMTQAARHFLASLSPEQQAKATFPFQSEERLNWHFIPRERKIAARHVLIGQREMLGHYHLRNMHLQCFGLRSH